jgi:hypothetical protein
MSDKEDAMSEVYKSATLHPFSAQSAEALAEKLNQFRTDLEPEERALLSELILAGQGGMFGNVSNFHEAVRRVLGYLADHSAQVQRMKADGMWAQWAAANGGS